MKKDRKILPILYYALLTIQVVLCIFWIVRSSLNLPLIYEGAIYLDAARNMKFDEYSGVLYPLFLRVFYLGLPDTAGRIAVAVLQFVTIFLSMFFFASRIQGKEIKILFKKKISIIFFVLSSPIIIYTVFLMTPEAFALSFFLVWCGYLLQDNKGTIDIFCMVTAYILSGFMSIKYAYILGAIWLVYILVIYRKKIFLSIVALISGVCIIIVLNMIFVKPGSYGRMPATLGTGLVSNFSYEVLVHDHYFWPEEAKAVIPFENLGNIMMDRSHVVTRMGEPLLANYSYWETDMLGYGIAKASIMVRSRETIDRFVDNLSNYLLTPVTFLENINGQGKSSTAINIYSMSGGNTKLTMIYMLTGLIINSILLIITGIEAFSKKQGLAGKNISFWLMAYIVTSVFWALFAFNYFDYMLMVPVITLGLILLADRRLYVCGLKK